MQWGIKAADEVKVDNQVSLRWRDYPGLSRPHHIITRVLRYGKGRQENDAVWESTNSGFEDEIGHHLIEECEQPLEIGKARKTNIP